MTGLCYVTPVTGRKADTGKEEEEDYCDFNCTSHNCGADYLFCHRAL
jgi:hypothetical protein